MRWIDLKGLRFRLYIIFVLFTLGIISFIGVVQIVSIRKQLRTDSYQQLEDLSRNISSAYGTTAYEKTIRSVVYGGKYVVRTLTEEGKLLLPTEDMERVAPWPDISLEIENIKSALVQGNGFFRMELEDTSHQLWLVYGQVVASWEGQRELVIIATSTETEKQEIRNQLFLLIKMTAFIMVAALIICMIITHSYLKPIAQITAGAKSLTKGDYSVSFPKNSYTEINTLSHTLELAADQFSNYEQMRRDMVANLSHDMRTPLTVIKAYAEMILNLSGDKPEKREHHLQVIISETHRLTEFVNASLELSKLQTREFMNAFVWMSLDELMISLVEKFQVVSGGEHKFVQRIEPGCQIYADEFLMERAICNLVFNAMKYGGADKIIELHVKKNHKKVRMEIVDHGGGIPEDKVNDIWTKYYKVNPFDKDSANTGVGLSIVREIFEIHSLEYGVEVIANEKTCFWAEFPKKKK